MALIVGERRHCPGGCVDLKPVEILTDLQNNGNEALCNAFVVREQR
jgi:hypothetical protein